MTNKPDPAQEYASGRDPLVERLLRWMPFAVAGHLFVGVPALLISLVVAYGTYVQAEATQRIQQAAAWPFVAYKTTNYSAEGERIVSLTLANDGLGPALIEKIEVSYDGKPVTTPIDLLASCCDFRTGSAIQLRLAPVIAASLRPGEELAFIRVPDVPANKNLIDRFELNRDKIRVRACYCSIFGDCWTIDGPQAKPQQVKLCPADWVAYG